MLNTQRDSVYAERMQALKANDLAPIMEDYARKTVDDILEVQTSFFLLLECFQGEFESHNASRRLDALFRCSGRQNETILLSDERLGWLHFRKRSKR